MFTIITTTITKVKQKMLNLILQNIFSEVALKKMKVGYLPRSNFKCVFFE